MITVGMNYRVLPGKEKQFEDVFNAVLEKMNGMEGHSESHLFRDINNTQQYLITSDWSDRAAFDGFIASDQFKSVTDWGKEQILSGRPSHEVYGGEEPTDAKECPAGMH